MMKRKVIKHNYFSIYAELFDYFASDPLDQFYAIDEIANNSNHPLCKTLNENLQELPDVIVKDVMKDKKFNFLYGDAKDRNYRARIFTFIKRLDYLIPSTRINLLKSQSSVDRPQPYSHSVLKYLELMDDYLVPLSDFEIQGSALFRRGFGFNILLPLPSRNSGYWFTQALCKRESMMNTKVRLDPLIIRERDQYPLMGYRMLCYGRGLDWARLNKLKEEEHGRWLSDKLYGRSVQFTDFVWSPRNNEIHFQCEELPKYEDIEIRGSRYLHGIYKPSEEEFVHIDAAVRIYDTAEFDARQKQHLRKIGKLGVRAKIFQIDGSISQQQFCNIASSFFVWNEDVEQYFSGN